jgi:hypothetical protein
VIERDGELLARELITTALLKSVVFVDEQGDVLGARRARTGITETTTTTTTTTEPAARRSNALSSVATIVRDAGFTTSMTSPTSTIAACGKRKDDITGSDFELHVDPNTGMIVHVKTTDLALKTNAGRPRGQMNRHHAGSIIGAVSESRSRRYRMLEWGFRHGPIGGAFMKTVSTPRGVCRDELVTQQKPVKDPHQITGTIAGAVIGGVLGSKVGDGSGQDIATVGGAAPGPRRQQGPREDPGRTEQQLQRDRTTLRGPDGYEVIYRLMGKSMWFTWTNAPRSDC